MVDKKNTTDKVIAVAIERLALNFESPNVMDSNYEKANIVDVINRLAKAVFALADAVEKIGAAKL